MNAPLRERWPFLPHLLMQMAQRFGLDTALGFAARHGGTVIYVPKRPNAEHEIAREFGVELLAWLIAFHDASPTLDERRLTVPMGPSQSLAQREAAVRELTARGLSRNQVARKLGIHARTVALIRARHRQREDSPQLDLFTRSGDA